MDIGRKVAHTMIEAAVNKGIRDIEENAGRGIRNLVDLGSHFSTGCFQKQLFDLAEQILKNKSSGYYKLGEQLIKHVDHNILTHFGINLGYNSWTFGAGMIRENEKNVGYNIPWTLVFDLRSEKRDILSVEEISDILKKAESLGIYAGMFFANHDITYMDALVKALASHRESAYFLFVQPEIVTGEFVEAVLHAANIAVAVAIGTDDVNQGGYHAIDVLFEKKCLYGSYCMYNDDNVQTLMSKAFNAQIEDMKCSFEFLVKGELVTEQSARELSEFILQVKKENPHPFFAVNFYQDVADVNQIISLEGSFMSITADGAISSTSMSNYIKDLNIRNKTLQSIFGVAMPKVQYG